MKTYRAARAAPLELIAEVRKHSGVLRKQIGVFGRSRPAAGLTPLKSLIESLHDHFGHRSWRGASENCEIGPGGSA
jgi:hypothetical protein